MQGGRERVTVVKISTHQFMILGAAVLMGTTFLPISAIVTSSAGRDGWMSVLPGFAFGIPYGLMLISLMEKYPRKNLLQISETILGKWIGKSIGVGYILITGYFGGLLLGQCGDIFERSIMPLTPVWTFYLGGLLLVLYLVWAGIEVFARFSEMVMPLIAISIILIVWLSLGRVEQGELMPILENGIKPVLFGIVKVMPFSMEYILFAAAILPFLPTGKQEIKQLKSGVWRAVFLIGILNTLIALIQILVFGPTETIRLVYGLLVLGKMVEISRTVSGVESIFMMIWLGALIIKICAFFFTALFGLETVFGLKRKKWMALVGILFLATAFGFVSGHSLIMEIGLVDNYVILPFTSLWIPILWGVSRWKKGASA